MQLYAQVAYDYAEWAYEKASYAVDGNTSFWGTCAIQYEKSEISVSAEVLIYTDLAVQNVTAGDCHTAEYYLGYALSFNATAKLSNFSVI